MLGKQLVFQSGTDFDTLGKKLKTIRTTSEFSGMGTAELALGMALEGFMFAGECVDVYSVDMCNMCDSVDLRWVDSSLVLTDVFPARVMIFMLLAR